MAVIQAFKRYDSQVQFGDLVVGVERSAVVMISIKFVSGPRGTAFEHQVSFE